MPKKDKDLLINNEKPIKYGLKKAGMGSVSTGFVERQNNKNDTRRGSLNELEMQQNQQFRKYRSSSTDMNTDVRQQLQQQLQHKKQQPQQQQHAYPTTSMCDVWCKFEQSLCFFFFQNKQKQKKEKENCTNMK